MDEIAEGTNESFTTDFDGRTRAEAHTVIALTDGSTLDRPRGILVGKQAGPMGGRTERRLRSQDALRVSWQPRVLL